MIQGKGLHVRRNASEEGESEAGNQECECDGSGGLNREAEAVRDGIQERGEDGRDDWIRGWGRVFVVLQVASCKGLDDAQGSIKREEDEGGDEGVELAEGRGIRACRGLRIEQAGGCETGMECHEFAGGTRGLNDEGDGATEGESGGGFMNQLREE